MLVNLPNKLYSVQFTPSLKKVIINGLGDVYSAEVRYIFNNTAKTAIYDHNDINKLGIVSADAYAQTITVICNMDTTSMNVADNITVVIECDGDAAIFDVVSSAAFGVSTGSLSASPAYYNSTGSALSTIPTGSRYIGMPVWVLNSVTSMITEYWFNGGTANNNLIIKSSGGVSKVDQVITFPALASKTYGAANFDLGAYSTSGLPVTYQFDDATILTQVSGSIYSIQNAGTVNITAIQPGDSNYNAATQVLRTLLVNKANQVINFASLGTHDYNSGSFASGITSTSGLPVTLASSNTAKANISGSSIVPVEDGSLTITATQAGNNNYNAAAASSGSLVVSISEIRVSTASRVYESETTNYSVVAGAYGGTTSKDVLDNLIKRLKANNLWTDIMALYVPYGGTTAGKKYNVKNPQNLDAAYRLTFPNGVTDGGTDDKWFFQPSSTQSADTQINLANISSSNFCITTYQTLRGSTTNDTNGVLMGASDGTNGLRLGYTPRQFQAVLGNVTMSMYTPTGSTSIFTDGIHSLYVKDGLATYDAAGAMVTQSVSTITLPSLNLYLGGLNINGTTSNAYATYSQLSIACVTKNITPGKYAVLKSILTQYNIERNLHTAKGVVFMGDSITQGYNATNWSTTSWAALVAAAKGWTDIQNYGVTGICLQHVGSNTNDVPTVITAKSSWNWGGAKPYNDKMQKMFIAYGINDSFQFNDTQNPLGPSFQPALTAFLDQMIAMGWPKNKMVLLNTYRIDQSKVNAGSDVRQQTINSIIQSVANGYGIQFIDIYSNMNTLYNGGAGTYLWGADGIHPLDVGHTNIANTITAVI